MQNEKTLSDVDVKVYCLAVIQYHHKRIAWLKKINFINSLAIKGIYGSLFGIITSVFAFISEIVSINSSLLVMVMYVFIFFALLILLIFLFLVSYKFDMEAELERHEVHLSKLRDHFDEFTTRVSQRRLLEIVRSINNMWMDVGFVYIRVFCRSKHDAEIKVLQKQSKKRSADVISRWREHLGPSITLVEFLREGWMRKFDIGFHANMS